jgi:LysR family transcriptional activator of nhaA
MVAKEGSITRAAERLDLSVQTISTQLGQLERQLGYGLLAPQGRSLTLTEAGRTALKYAEQIFHLGTELRRALAETRAARTRLSVGVTDAVPKLAAFRLLENVLRPPLSVQLECREGPFDRLLGDLAVNRLDLVVADRSAPQFANLKLHSHLLGTVGVDLYGIDDFHPLYAPGFPESLNGAPLLLPVRDNPLRAALDAWFETRNLKPDVVGEFSDSALLKTFGRAGVGLFPAPAGMREDIASQYRARPIGTFEGVSETWFAVSAQRKTQHPAISAVLAASRLPT